MHYFKLLFSGAVVLALSTVCSADILTNGGFETGDFTGWVLGGDLSQPYDARVNTNAPNSGTYAAHIGDEGFNGPTTLSQTFNTIGGAFYDVNFWYGEYNSNDPSGYLGDPGNTDPNSPFYMTNGLTGSSDGSGSTFSDTNFFTNNQPVSGTNPGGGASQGDYFYEHGSFGFYALGSTSTITFAGYDFQQDVILDDVSVLLNTDHTRLDVTPEPSSYAFVAGLLVCLGVAVRRKQRQQQA